MLVANNDACFSADILELFPDGQRTRLYLDARGKKAAPPGSTPSRWEDEEWEALKTEMLEGPESDTWRPWTKPLPVGPTPEELAAEAAAAEAKAAEEAKAAAEAEAAAAEAAAAEAEAEAAAASKNKKKKILIAASNCILTSRDQLKKYDSSRTIVGLIVLNKR